MMDSESEAVFMQNLQEYLLDEGKVLTCTWLSSTFSLHINAVRELILKFLNKEDIKKHSKNFERTYFVSGILKNNEGLVSSIIREDNLVAFKEKLDIIYSEHLYSIQQKGSVTDLALLYIANHSEEPCNGVIKNSLSTKRSDLESSRGIAYPVANTKLITNATGASKTAPNSFKVDIKKENNCESSKKNYGETSEVNVKADEKPKSVIPNNNNKNVKKPGNIAGFFSKQATNTKKKVENISSKEIKKEKINTVSSVKVEVSRDLEKDAKEVASKNINIKKENVSPISNVKSKNIEVDSDKNGTKKHRGNNKKDVGKKRKRIQALESDSEEESTNVDIDDIFTADSPERADKPQLSDDDEDVIPPTPEVKSKGVINPRKRKKVVDKTFMDENGYIITKKEEIFESCSENEDDKHSMNKDTSATNGECEPKVQSKKPAVSPAKSKKKSPPQVHGKQQSLMSFFKKASK